MSGTFDPYHRWLGISHKDQPAHHYRLLGVDLFEGDREVIRDAAERQMAHVRSYQLGKYSHLSQKILNELAAAKACLLDPEKKTAYDAWLQDRQGAVRRSSFLSSDASWAAAHTAAIQADEATAVPPRLPVLDAEKSPLVSQESERPQIYGLAEPTLSAEEYATPPTVPSGNLPNLGAFGDGQDVPPSLSTAPDLLKTRRQSKRDMRLVVAGIVAALSAVIALGAVLLVYASAGHRAPAPVANVSPPTAVGPRSDDDGAMVAPVGRATVQPQKQPIAHDSRQKAVPVDADQRASIDKRSSARGRNRCGKPGSRRKR